MIIYLAIILLSGIALMAKKYVFVKYAKGASPFEAIIKKYSVRYNVPVSLIKAFIQAESSWNVNAFRDDIAVDSYGLMQITDLLIQDYGYRLGGNIYSSKMYDPDFNISIGVQNIARLINKYPLNDAIQMYNVGVTGFLKRGYTAKTYLARILSYKAQYEAI